MAMKSFKSTLAGIASRVGDTQAALTTIDTDLDTAIAAFVAKTATDAAIGVLVADAASPTQAHVNDLVAAWATFETAWDSAQVLLAAVAVKSTAAMAVIDADANFSVNTTLSMNEVLAALRAFETQARSTF